MKEKIIKNQVAHKKGTFDKNMLLEFLPSLFNLLTILNNLFDTRKNLMALYKFLDEIPTHSITGNIYFGVFKR